MISANIRGARTRKLIVAASEAPGSWWALGTSARGLNLPGALLGELQFAATDLTP
jgi:hypothetical protein